MATALYRISSGECIKISQKDQPFSDRDVTYWGVLTDPTLPDGTDTHDLSGAEPGVLRVLGWSKIAVPGSNTVRNALQVEIDTFATAELDDEGQQDADQAADLAETHPRFRRLVRSMLRGIVRENNIMAERFNTLRAEILAATSLSNLQSRIETNTQDAPIRTNQQAFDAIRTDVTKDD